ncbi:hypothetical protein [Dokdonella sp.]|uniref:hypothetical protein n=1 Tax=Dokdonella sp. TaxID=2291710 RepID=UPI003527C2DB
MSRFPDANTAARLSREDSEPAAEWLGGEAWVTAMPAMFYARDSKPAVRDEPAAADWIPV